MYKSLVFGDEFLSHLKSHLIVVQLLSADQSSSSTLTESSFLFDLVLYTETLSC